MALYKNLKFLDQVLDTDNIFEDILNPKQCSSYAGIYRCINCGYEIAIHAGLPLPDTDIYHNKTNSHEIKWQLVVVARNVIKN